MVFMNLPSIETARLFLRVYEPEDLDARHAIRNDPDVYQYFPPYYSPPTKENRRHGLTQFLVKMKQPGIQVNPSLGRIMNAMTIDAAAIAMTVPRRLSAHSSHFG